MIIETVAARKKTKGTRGGYRPGAGRPALFAESADLTVRFERSEFDALSEIASERAVSVAEVIREAARAYLARRKRG